MNKKKPNKTRDYQATADIIGRVYDVIEDFENNERNFYTPSAKKLAAKIIAEWSRSLKTQIKKAKNPKRLTFN